MGEVGGEVMRAIFLALALAVALPSVGCAKQGRPESGAVDESLMAWLSSARALHHEADMAEDAGDIDGAIKPLDRLLTRPTPRKAPEIDEVLEDTRARLADLRSRKGDFDAAAKDAEQGLALATAVSYYRGHLLEVRGLVEERRAKALLAKGDTAAAAKAKDLAMKSYEEAIAVQDEVIKRGTNDGGSQ